MASEHTVTTVLLEWINSFSLGKTLRAIDELTDGIILWEILQDIDAQHFLVELPERNPSDLWLAKWQNLKHIHKHLTTYIRYRNKDQGNQLPPGLDPLPNLEAIAEKNSAKETNKLLKLLLIAAISSPNNASYIETLQTLSTDTQEVLRQIIVEARDGQYEPTDAGDDAKDDLSKRDLPVDLGLQFEERVGKVIAENDRLTHEKKEMEKALEDLHNRLARLQENNDTLQNRLASTEDRLVNLKSGRGDLGFNAKALETRTRQQDDLIASQETRLSASQDEIDSLRMTVESLRVKSQRFQKLQDDYDELKTEKDQLARKANAAEKYRQKLQTSQDFEKENQTLKNQIKDIQQQLKDADSQHRWSAEREVELEEYRRVLPRIEQECNEIQNLKKQLEFNNHALTERLNSAEEQHERDDSMISELRERLGEKEGSPESPSFTPRPGSPNFQGTLQKDFETANADESELYESPTLSPHAELTRYRKLENDEVKKEPESPKAPSASVSQPQWGNQRRNTNNDGSKNGSGLEGYSANFMQLAQFAQVNSTQKYVSLFSYAASAKASRSEEYWRLFENYTKSCKDLAAVQDAYDNTKRSLADATAQSESIQPNSNLCTPPTHSLSGELVDKEKLDIVNEIRESNSVELTRIRDDWDELIRRIHSLTAEADASHALVRAACHERDELRGMLDKKQTEIQAEDQNLLDEMQRFLAEFQDHGVGLDSSQKPVEEFVKQCAGIIEKNTERLAKRAEVSQKLSLYDDLLFFIPVKDLDKSRPFEPVDVRTANQTSKKPEKGFRFKGMFGRK